ncbi:unnamed protein product [Meloidogyne enterolobii]|uniref:Uncharacterized protein n=1 Tax=Meloidogyne enterolobii TaxID=390850 RepID=A0ACB1ATI1_MELEN
MDCFWEIKPPKVCKNYKQNFWIKIFINQGTCRHDSRCFGIPSSKLMNLSLCLYQGYLRLKKVR